MLKFVLLVGKVVEMHTRIMTKNGTGRGQDFMEFLKILKILTKFSSDFKSQLAVNPKLSKITEFLCKISFKALKTEFDLFGLGPSRSFRGKIVETLEIC